MKLNYKRTILVGFAFFLICAFWQAYDNTVPLILTNKFGMSQTWSGVIMALDNVLALFMLPLFGHLSDKCTSPKGRRTPFIVIGTLVAACALVALSFVDNAQLRHLRDVSAIDDPAALSVIYERQKDATLLSPGGESFILGQKFTEEEFTAIRSQTVTEDGEAVTDPAYTNYVVPARQACAEAVTRAHPATVILFVALLLIILLSMATFRSPAVALMPDVTPKPLRSRANAIINLMGAVGGITYLLTAALLYPNSKTAGVQHVNYQPLFVAVSLLMAAAVVVLYFTTNEPKLAAAEKEYEAAHPEQQLVEEEPDGSEELPKEVRRSLVMLLNSIALWYIGYNGVTTWWTTYVARVMGQGLGGASTCLLVATGGAIVSYIPVGQLASKIGRKKTIQGGVILLAACFASAYFLTTHYQSINAVMFVVFALVGLAWAAINVNSLPMVVEMCKGSDIGKFTGYYYTFSMAAQVVTPILAGTLLKHISYSMLFPYAAFFVACSFVTMCFVRHGDCKVEAKAGLAAFEDMDAD